MYMFPLSHNMDFFSNGGQVPCINMYQDSGIPESEVKLMRPALKISKPEFLVELKSGIAITCAGSPLKLQTNIVKKDDDHIVEVTDAAGLRRFYCEVKEMHQAGILINMFLYVYDTKNNNVGYCNYDEKVKLYDNIIKGLLRDMK